MTVISFYIPYPAPNRNKTSYCDTTFFYRLYTVKICSGISGATAYIYSNPDSSTNLFFLIYRFLFLALNGKARQSGTIEQITLFIIPAMTKHPGSNPLLTFTCRYKIIISYFTGLRYLLPKRSVTRISILAFGF